MITTKNGISISYSGQGNDSPSVYANVNEGLDKQETFKVETTNKAKSVEVVVTQQGRREEFGEFCVSDGGTFNVIKNGL